jgi:acetyl-CoA carboxylase alpha subunit
MFTNFIELHGDRFVHDDKAIIGGFAQLDGKTIMAIGHQKGTNTKCANTGISEWRILKDTGKLSG